MKKLKVKHITCTCDECLYYWYKPPCKGCGNHNSFWATVIESAEWKIWKKYADPNMMYDFSEVEELGCISPKHFQDFLDYTFSQRK